MSDPVDITIDFPDPIISDVVINNLGPPGIGVPAGGTTGQHLAKASNTSFDTTWVAAGQNPDWSNIVNKPAYSTQSSDATHDGYLTQANWSTFNGKQASLGFTAENVANKVTAFSSPTDTQYPSAKLVSDQLATKGTSSFSGAYADLSGKPTLGTAAAQDTTAFDASGAAASVISDTAYNSTSWNSVTTIAPSKNAVRDWIETLGSAAYTAIGAYDVAGAAAAVTPTSLGLVIGTNVQAYDADLTTWAGITPGTGVGTALAINVGTAGSFVTNNISGSDALAAKGADIASGSTTDLSTATGPFINVTGTTTINSFGTVTAGTRRMVRFTGAGAITYNATSLILLTSASITRAAGDYAVFESLGSGNWRCLFYQKFDGTALVGGVVDGQQIFDDSHVLAADFGTRQFFNSDGITVVVDWSDPANLVFPNGLVVGDPDGDHLGIDSFGQFTTSIAAETISSLDGLTYLDNTGFHGDGSNLTGVVLSGGIGSVIAGTKTATGAVTTTFTVTIGQTMADTDFKVVTEGNNALSAAVHYVNNKTTTTFDVVYLAGLTGAVSFDWIVTP